MLLRPKRLARQRWVGAMVKSGSCIIAGPADVAGVFRWSFPPRGRSDGGIGFSEAAQDQIATTVAERTCVAAQGSAVAHRPCMQSYGAIVAYFTEEHWGAMMDPRSPARTAIDVITPHCVNLQLRNPTELTLQLLATSQLCIAESAERAASMPPAMKYTTPQHMKKALRARSRGMPLTAVSCQANPGPSSRNTRICVRRFSGEAGRSLGRSTRRPSKRVCVRFLRAS